MAAYHVDSARFEKMDEPEVWYGVNETCCNAGDVVRKVFTIAANDGFTFADAEEVSVKVNGVEADIINAGEYGIEVEVRYAICNGFEPIHGVVPVNATIPELAVGDTMNAVVVTVDDGVNYAVSEVKWLDIEGNDVTGTVAEDGEIYCLMITVKANDGYFFTGWDGIMLGEESVETSFPGDEFGNSLSLDGYIYFSFAEEITSVAVTCADVELGKTFPVAAVADDANYVVSNQHWRNVTDDERVEEGAVAEDGKVYDLVINLQPKDGYAFAEECTATLNGQETGCNRNSHINLDVFLNVAFCDDIARADLTVGDVAFGEPAPTPVAPAGANYSVLDHVWIECETDEAVSVLEQGGRYNLLVHVRPAAGYRFVEDTAFYIDGERAHSYDVGNMIFEVVRYYSFCERIDKVELTIPEAVLGAAPCAPDAVVLPSDALYTMTDSSGWVDEDGEPITVFADKQRYTFAVLLKANPFCEFDGGTEVYVNGKLMSEADVEINSDQVIVWYRASFKDRITEVALPAWPELKVGDTLPGITPVVSADGKYEYSYQWNYLYDGEATVAEEGLAIAGLLCAVPVDGAAEFADDVKVTIGGVAATPLFYDYSYDSIVLAKIYSFSDEVKLIDKIEITAELPEAGEGLGKISVPEDALYTLETEWGYTETAEGLDGIQGLSEGDSFEAGQYAWIVPMVYAKEGCLIAPDAEIYVNGKKFIPEKDNVMFDDYELLYVAFAHRLGKVQGVSFADIDETSWQYQFAQYAVKNGLMAGKGTDGSGNIKFDPNSPITREEFVQVLYNAEGKPAISIANPFPDVADGGWYKNAVLWAKQNDIASGKGNGNFGVGENISRQDLAMMLYKYAKLNGYSLAATEGLINGYADGDMVASYAKTAMDWAVSNGIMSGKGTAGQPLNTFRLDPTGIATRAECAAMLKNFKTAFGG